MSKICAPATSPYHTASNMARTKDKVSESSAKRRLLNDDPFLLDKADRPTKKAKLLDESDEDSDAEGAVALKVNEDYARRFEHNKKREEKHRRR